MAADEPAHGPHSSYNPNLDGPTLGIWGFFKKSRAICKAVDRPTFELGSGATGSCGVPLAHLTTADNKAVTLGPNESISGQVTLAFAPTWKLQNVPEDVIDAAMQDLAAGPETTAVLVENAHHVTGTRLPFRGDFTDPVCSLEPRSFGAGDAIVLFLFTGTEGYRQFRFTNCTS